MRTPLVPGLDRTPVSAAAYRAAFTEDPAAVLEAATNEARRLAGVADDDRAGAAAAEDRARAVIFEFMSA